MKWYNYVADIIGVLFILFCIWLIICSMLYKDKVDKRFMGDSQSDRQKENKDYDTNYYP